MVPLGPLKTAHPEVMEHYRTIVDRYDRTVYRNMIVAGLEGVTPYNRYINRIGMSAAPRKTPEKNSYLQIHLQRLRLGSSVPLE